MTAGSIARNLLSALGTFCVTNVCIAQSDSTLAPASPASRYHRAVLVDHTFDDRETRFSFSAPVVEHDNGLFIVAPQVQAKKLTAATRIGIRVPGFTPQWARLGEISDWSTGSPWFQRSPEDEVMILPVRETSADQSTLAALRAIAIPLESMRMASPARGTRIDIVGFVVLVDLSNNPPPDPITWSSVVASAELRFPEEFRIPLSFLVTPAAPATFIGAPVFLHDDDESATKLVGVAIAQKGNDDSGGKWSLVTPARVIAETIRGYKQQ